MDIEEIRRLCSIDAVVLTQHLIDRMNARGIVYPQVKQAIMTGDIIESYQDDKPFPSCLMLGFVPEPLHVVCAISPSNILIITSYHPDSDRWFDDMRSRRPK